MKSKKFVYLKPQFSIFERSFLLLSTVIKNLRTSNFSLNVIIVVIYTKPSWKRSSLSFGKKEDFYKFLYNKSFLLLLL